MAKKNYDKRARERWRRKINKEKQEKDARLERMYLFMRTRGR